MGIELDDGQRDAISKMKNGCILCGGVGSGKSRTAIGYYFVKNGGSVSPDEKPMPNPPKNLYIVTTAKKRDSGEWESDLAPFLLSTDKEKNRYSNIVSVDSWNNIKKYSDIKDSFFIFDEQRVVGSGTWVKSFLKIAKNNEWVLLSATPGDTWSDYIPVFIANGFYRTRTQFNMEHVVWSRYSTFPKIDRYINQGKLIKFRNDILIDIDFKRQTIQHHEYLYCDYEVNKYKYVIKNRWDLWNDKPIDNASELCYLMRRSVNESPDRQNKLLELLQSHPKAIIFYNFDYELNMLKRLFKEEKIVTAEWNGHKHESVPKGDKWAYLVQYTAGSEGWNCIETDTIIFYSQNYSYRMTVQAAGRIDRRNTPFHDLYYYHLLSRSGIDLAIRKALSEKKTFNERGYIDKTFVKEKV